MPRNFIIAYTAREGSSAIISRLSLNPNIAVPAFEELDEYWLKRIKFKGRVSTVLDHVFRHRSLPFNEDRLFQKFIPRKPNGHETICGLKWRIHGNILDIGRVLKKNKVVVFFLFRRDVVELASSLHISRRLDRPGEERRLGHFQFRVSQMTEEQKALVRDQIANATVNFDFYLFRSIIIKRVLKAFHFYVLSRLLRLWGIPVYNIFYEDFQQYPEVFIDHICHKTGVALEETSSASSKFEKLISKPASQRLGVPQDVLQRLDIRALCTLYRFATAP